MSGPTPEPTRLAHYDLEARIGEGAMGVVHRAHDRALDRPVAVKVLRSELDAAPLLERFFREARAAARVNHPNLAHVYFVGEEGGRAFFAMELVPGLNLEERVRKEGPFAIERAVDVAIQVARGLEAAHRAGVIHRDVKPSNVILQDDGVAKVTDFGLALSLDAEIRTTKAGQVMGTPTFMSPEQCRGAEATARSDVYALGLTLFYLLAGREPFQGPALGAVLDDQMNRPLPSLVDLGFDVPARVDRALAKLCAKAPANRPADMGAAADLLETCRPRPIHPAPLVGRAVAAALDLAIAATLFAACMFLLTRLFGAGVLSSGSAGGGPLLGAIFALLHVGGEYWHGQTPGKWFLALHVVTERGLPPRLPVLVLRYILRYPLFALGLSGLTLVADPIETVAELAQGAAIVGGIATFLVTRGQSLSDHLTRTRVAQKMGAPVPAAAEVAS